MVRAWLEVTSEGLEGTAALVAAADLAGLGGSVVYEPSVKAARMERLLSHPDVKAAIRGVFGEVGFEVDEAAGILVKHIRGEFEDGDGKAIPPSLPALKEYLARALPTEPKRLHVLSHRTQGPVREARADGSPPPLAARPIGEVIGEVSGE